MSALENGAGTDVAASATRGVVAAMAMTGMRRMTTGLGLLQTPPPEQVAREGVPHLFGRVPPEFRDEAIELLHWGVGGAGGALYGLLPDAARRRRLVGVAYGLAIWVGFEAAVAPLLGIDTPRRRWGISDRLAIAADHVLYGLILSGGTEHGGNHVSPRRRPLLG